MGSIDIIYNRAKRHYWINRIEYFIIRSRRKDEIPNLYFYKCGNFGDELNDELMRYFEIKYRHARPLGSDLCCIGSNLQEFVKRSSTPVSSNHVVNVLGSGFISEAHGNESFMFSMNIYALRGQLSKHRCEKAINSMLRDVVLGDPGLLIMRMYPRIKLSREYDVGIICHMVDKNSELLKNIELKDKNVLYIDVDQDPDLFVEQVAKCGFILSSAMHGLICADSLGIPNKHIILGNKVVGGEYKFRDYYSVFPSFKYSPVNLKDIVISDKEIDEYRLDYNITKSEIEEICDNLQRAFEKFKVEYSNV